MYRIFFFIILFYALFIPVDSYSKNTVCNESKNRNVFKVYDGTLFLNKPPFLHGMERINIIYESRFFKRNTDVDYPKLDVVKKEAYKAVLLNLLTVIDVEYWPVQSHRVDVIDESISKYIQLAKSFKTFAPSNRIGYFGIVPVGNPEKSIAAEGSALWREWVGDNLRVSPISKYCDVIFPEAYTSWEDRHIWSKSAVNSVNQARLIAPDKPVVLFLSPYYASVEYTPPNIRSKPVSPDYWRYMLEFSENIADGVVIWCGWNSKTSSPDYWDSNAPWWLETIDFLKSRNVDCDR